MMRRSTRRLAGAAAFPTQAQVVVVGGGIIGSSIAYHLARQGCKDVVHLERDKITSGTTWHAAGLCCAFGSNSETSTHMRMYSKKLYKELEAETGQATGLKLCGFIEMASTEDHLEQFRRTAQFNKLMGVDVHEIGPEEIKKLFPLCNTEGVLRGFYVPDDGRVNPVDVTMALAKGARQRGVKQFENTPVTKILTKGRAVSAVETAQGTIQCETVVNCAGMWGRQLGAQNGVHIPLQAAEHYYLLTEKIPGVSGDWPVIEDPARYGYYREEGGGLLVGLFEPKCAPWNVKGIPHDSSFTTITPDWERITPYLETAMSRVPAAATVGVKQLFCGPESFTPDLGPCIGEAPEVKNYWMCCGLNSIGILTGGGLGRLMANWILTGKPDADVTGMHVDRLQEYQANPNYLSSRIVESLGLVYACHYPTRSMATCRNLRLGPFHDRLAKQGAYFKEVSGWEGADWYAGAGHTPKVDKLTWGKHNWWPHWVAEHNAVRNGVALIDMSFMCKFVVKGPGAGKALNWVSCNNVDAAANRITYTQWVNKWGLMEADLTVTKLGEDDFFIVATDTALRHVQAHFKKHAPDTVQMIDVSSGVAQLNVQGPKSRELMQRVVTGTDMGNDAFPFRHAQHVWIGMARVLVIRITYVGELGYELYIPSDQALHVFDLLMAEGKSLGVRPAGLKALASCRMEKGYKDYGHDMDNTDSVLDCGLGFAVSMKKEGGFLGKEAVQAHKASGKMFKQRLVQVLCLDPDQFLFGVEPVLYNGQPKGYVRCASYGHSVGGAVGLVMIEASPDAGHEKVTKEYLASGKWEVNIAGKLYPARLSIESLFDPQNKKIMC